MAKNYVALKDGKQYLISPSTFKMDEVKVGARAKTPGSEWKQIPPCGDHYFEFTLAPTQLSLQPLLADVLDEMRIVTHDREYSFRNLSLEEWKDDSNEFCYCGVLVMED